MDYPAIGNIYPDFCCVGFMWEVIQVLPLPALPQHDSIWGKCQNPECPILCCPSGCHWRGVSDCTREEFLKRCTEAKWPEEGVPDV
jgi:hypothetical protein